MSETEHETGLNVRWLEARTLTIQWDPDLVQLTVALDTEPPIPDVRARLAFPLSHPNGFVQLADAKNKPVGMLQSMDDLTPPSRAALKSALDTRYLIPLVAHILDLREVSPFVLRWHVATDRGEWIYSTESPREAFRHLGPDRIRITDLAGNHFDIRSISELDPASRKRLGHYL